MERVSFITTEAGDDLILSFAVQRHDEASGIESLILMRTQEYELDVRKVGADELKKMYKLLKKMNYDQKFQTSGV